MKPAWDRQSHLHAIKQVPEPHRGAERHRVGDATRARCTARQARSAPLVEDFGVWLREQRARVSPPRPGETPDLIANHWDGLQVFLQDRHVEMDSNAVENTIRPLA